MSVPHAFVFIHVVRVCVRARACAYVLGGESEEGNLRDFD